MANEYEILNSTERITLSLRSLYQQYGYAQYKMSKFEEYDLYARHKDFLISDGVITFTDLSGRLMALKPDVTLSIVRSSRDLDGVRKLYYTENVYRIAKASRNYKEIMQAGLECLGEVDGYCLTEVVYLAAESLRRISEHFVLDISHLGLLSSLLDRLALPADRRDAVLRCIGSKNPHELSALCADAEPQAAEALRQLAQVRGTPAEVLPKLRRLGCDEASLQELSTLTESLAPLLPEDCLRLDFSLTGDPNYYNGIVFKGFVSGVPESVLSGGQYDRLMEKMDRSSRAVGFAVYLDTLERLNAELDGYDTDLLLLYDDTTDSGILFRTIHALIAQGVSVNAQKCIPKKLKYKRLARLEGNEVIELDGHA